MSEEESTNSKDEDKQCRMENKINSIDARILGMRDDIDNIGQSVVVNRLIIVVFWLLGMAMIWFWLSRAI